MNYDSRFQYILVQVLLLGEKIYSQLSPPYSIVYIQSHQDNEDLKMKRISIILCVCFAAIREVGASTRHLTRDERTGHIGSTREEVYARRERRKDHFAGRQEELKQQLDDHQTGRRLLEGREVRYLERKIQSYERKLEQLNKEFDDRVR